MAKKWMAEAFKNAHGQLRGKAKAKGMIKGDEPMSLKDVSSLAASGSAKTRKQANLAKTAMKINRNR